MFISLLIFIALLITVLRTVNFSLLCFKDKNITGGISVLFLVALVVASGFILLK